MWEANLLLCWSGWSEVKARAMRLWVPFGKRRFAPDGRGRPSLHFARRFTSFPIARRSFLSTIAALGRCFMFLAKGPYCQSCGMPLSKDQKGGGTEADGRVSAEYCSHCYLGGAFTDPTLTEEQMMERVRGKLKERH